MAIGGTTVGDAYIQIRANDQGFEAAVVRDVEKAVSAANAKAKISPTVDSSKATGPLDLIKSKLQSFAGKNPLSSALGDITTATGGAESALSGFATGGIAVAGAAIVAFAAKGIQSFQQLAGEVKGFKRVTGETAESSSQFVAAFKATGTNVDSATAAMGRLSKNVTLNAAALQAQGLTIAKTKSGSVDLAGTFLNLADVTKNMSDVNERNTLLNSALGRSYKDLLPILGKGKEGIQELFKEADKRHAFLHQDDLDKSTAFTVSIRTLGEEFSGLEREVGEKAIPALTTLASAVTSILEKVDSLVNDLGSAQSAVADFFDGIAGHAGPAKGIVHDFGKELSDQISISGVLNFATSGATGALGQLLGMTQKNTKASKDAAEAKEAEAEATKQESINSAEAAKLTAASTAAAAAHKTGVDSLTSAIKDVTAARDDEIDADKAVITAKSKAGDAQAKLDTLVRAGTIDTKALTSAKNDEISAEKGVREAQEKVASSMRNVESVRQTQEDAINAQATAQEKLNKLISGQQAAEDMLAHKHDLEHAQLNVREATAGLRDAQADLATKQADGTTTAAELSDAQLRVDEATLSLQESQEDLTKTQDDLNKIQHEGDVGSTAYNAALKDVDDTTRAVDEATGNLMASYGELNDAQIDLVTSGQTLIDKQAAVNLAMQPDPVLVAAIKAAGKDAAEAWSGVAEAQKTASEKAADLGEKTRALAEINHGSIPDLQEIKSNLEAIVKLQPGAAAFLGPEIDLINGLIAAATTLVVSRQQAAQRPGASPILTGPAVPARASGGYVEGSFLAGENGPELINLRSGGGAMVYSANSPESQAAVGGGANVYLTIAPTFQGPGWDEAGIRAVMTDIANEKTADGLRAVLDRFGAGRRSGR